jgi:hypothetical protein
MYVAAFERRAAKVIEDRNLRVGTRLVASYKKQTYVCVVEAAEDGDGVVFALEGGKRFKSPSAAGSVVMGGKAVNGWRFWSLEGKASAPAEAKAPKPGAPKTKGEPESPVTDRLIATAGKPARRRTHKLIYKVPNQQGTPEGKQKFFCTACMKGFLVDAGATPEVCPEGHRTDDPELTGAVGAAEAGSDDSQEEGPSA